MSESFDFEITASEPGARLDSWLHRQLPQLSRTALARLIESKYVTVNGEPTKARYSPRPGDRVSVTIPPPTNTDTIAEAIPLEVLYEDEHLLVINKPPGMCVHPSAGHDRGTLVNALLHHCAGQLSGIGGVSRPGIVHRLDQDTSGCIVVAKDDQTHTGLAAQFANRTTRKSYLAITCGVVTPVEGEIIANIARHPSHRKRMAVSDGSGRDARTSYSRVDEFNVASLVRAQLHTGRTHQIRVHLKHVGYPIFGDEVYGNRQTKQLEAQIRFTPARQMLHANTLQFEHPIEQCEVSTEAPIPLDMQKTLQHLKNYRETIA